MSDFWEEKAASREPSGRRILFAPVPITPTKPLTLSHMKGLLWGDVLVRATRLLNDVDYLYSHMVANLNGQTLGFWSYLDAAHPGMDFTDLDEEQIGSLYVKFQQKRELEPLGDLSAYHDAVENDGWLHPAGRRILELWEARFGELGVRDAILDTPRKPPVSLDEVVGVLASRGFCIDHRPWRGPVFLDATSRGMPLRQIVGADGHANYLAIALRELIPLASSYDEIVLACDQESLPDYTLLQHVLASLGPRVSLVALGRVRVGEGAVRSSRHGGWNGLTAAPLTRQYLVRVDPQVYRLGLRLYFIAFLGQGDRGRFRADLMWRCMARAHRLLERAMPPTDPKDLPALLCRDARPHSYVHPYRFTSSLLARARPAVGPELMRNVFT